MLLFWWGFNLRMSRHILWQLDSLALEFVLKTFAWFNFGSSGPRGRTFIYPNFATVISWKFTLWQFLTSKSYKIIQCPDDVRIKVINFASTCGIFVCWPELHWIGTPWAAVPAVPLLAHFSTNHQASMTNAVGVLQAMAGRTEWRYPHVSYSNILWDVDQLEVNVCEKGSRAFGPDSSRGQPWAFRSQRWKT